MQYQFDEIINREGTSSVKYDLRKELFGQEDVTPMWVADMDFATPEFIREAVIKRARHPVYGYSFRPPEFFESIISWMRRRHRWDIRKEWISFSPGIVPAVNMAVLAFTDPGDRIILQPPVYHPFFNAVRDHGREIVYNQLIHKDGRYSIDFEDLEDKARTSGMLIFCHPHNPVGRAWTRNELETLTEICRKHHVYILSDEIHSDLLLNGKTHIPLLTCQGAEEITLSCYAPSKTFNLAGLSTSFLITPNRELRINYEKILNGLHIGMGNIFGTEALKAAYDQGEQWLDELIGYLRGNLHFLENFAGEHLPDIRITPTEATYLVWIDFRKYGMNDHELKQFIIHQAGLGLNDGPVFGPGGSGFQRMNIALPRKKLADALGSLKKALDEIRSSGR